MAVSGSRALFIAAVVTAVAPAAAAGAVRGHPFRGAMGVRVSSAHIRTLEKAAGPRSHHVLPFRTNPSRRRAGGTGTGASRPAAAGSPRTAVTQVAGFAGPTLTDSGAFPPDTMGAVGPTQFVVAINGRFRSYSKATGLADGALNVDPDAFFDAVMTPPAGDNFTSDPHIRYDRLSQRWFIVMIDVPGQAGAEANRVMIAVSDGPTITGPGDFTLFFFDQAAGGGDNLFADYPTPGIDANAIYVGANMFTLAGNFSKTNMYVVRKSSVLGGGPIVVTRFDGAVGGGPGPFTPQGVDNFDPSATTGYFVGVDNAVFSQLDVRTVTDPGGTPVLSGDLPVTVPATRLPINVPHLGNTGGALDALDDRLFAAQLRDGHIWTAHNIGVNSSGAASSSPSRDASRWYEVDVSGTPSLVQSGTIFDSAATSPDSYWIPTVATSGQGIMAIGGSVAGAAHHADAWFSGRLPGDPAGQTDAPTEYTASSFAYNPPGDPGSPRRWGDYSMTSVDPSDDMTMWTIQEYTASANTWGTRFAELQAPPPATPFALSTVALGQSSTTAVLTGSTASGRGFFDPGPGFDRPQATVGCGISVSGVQVDDPGHATLTLDTTAASGASPCLVTFTNPDGQQASASLPVDYGHLPVANDDSYSVPEDGTLNGSSVLANDSDPDSDPLTASKASDPAHGSVTVNADGTFTYTPNHDYNGPDSFTYRASDGSLQSIATVSISVTRVDKAPVAADDAFTVAQGATLNGSSVLANDSDPDGDALAASKASDPAHGAVSVNADGTFSYMPDPSYSGPDSFSYRASDGSLQSTATVSIAVTPAMPAKLTMKLKKLRHHRLRASGRGPEGKVVKVVVKRGKKRVARRRRTVVNGRWKVVVKARRHGRYKVVATSGAQRVTKRKRL